MNGYAVRCTTPTGGKIHLTDSPEWKRTPDGVVVAMGRTKCDWAIGDTLELGDPAPVTCLHCLRHANRVIDHIQRTLRGEW